MLIVYAVAGVLVLVFLIRRFVRHRQTLEQYRDERERHAESVLASIRHENECLEPSEALQPVLAGLESGTSRLSRDAGRGYGADACGVVPAARA